MPLHVFDAPGRILVVDDLQANRDLVGDFMEGAGHGVRLAGGAEEALKILQSWEPDVILLDVMMPEIDGLQLCKILKTTPATVAVPIILMTAMSDRALRIRGIEAGADEYLIKPIDGHEVVLRVRNAIRSKRMFDGMKRAHEELHRLECLRDSMTHMLVHDLRSPLMGISLCLEAMNDDAKQGHYDQIDEDTTSCIGITATLTEMIGTILDVSRLEAGAMPIEPKPVDVRLILEDGIARVRKGAQPSIEIEGTYLIVTWDKCLVSRAVANLVSNAMKYSSGKTVKVRCLDLDRDVEIQVDDQGPGVSPDLRQRIFEKFGSLGTGEAKRNSTGLGLFFCKQVASAHGGVIGVSSLEKVGSRFWLRLPKVASCQIL